MHESSYHLYVDNLMKKGFTLIEMLVGLFFIPMILGLTLGILGLLKTKEESTVDQVDVFGLQIRQFLNQASNVEIIDSSIVGSYNDKEFEIFFDRNRLVKRPGYEILLMDVIGVDIKGNCFNVYLSEDSVCIEKP